MCPDEIGRIDIGVSEQNQGKIVLEGIAFSNSISTPPSKKETATKQSSSSRGNAGNNKSKKGRNTKKTAPAAPLERKRIKCSRVDDGSGVNVIAIRGSCPQYDTRVDITDQLRCMEVSYGKAMDT